MFSVDYFPHEWHTFSENSEQKINKQSKCCSLKGFHANDLFVEHIFYIREVAQLICDLKELTLHLLELIWILISPPDYLVCCSTSNLHNLSSYRSCREFMNSMLDYFPELEIMGQIHQDVSFKVNFDDNDELELLIRRSNYYSDIFDSKWSIIDSYIKQATRFSNTNDKTDKFLKHISVWSILFSFLSEWFTHLSLPIPMFDATAHTTPEKSSTLSYSK